ncbi:hypothetical protein PsorP6_011322 [Peronosclerospora sorghi]|uniref:Uncharacterized protein n=1 Tax=Peronosclerospora sorghi TaxID=230839 RepID=A0ACC0WII9_9STRA|nr:hypothetical protein PsorP6_011322 [Peronosclerospora sorghi]
MYLGVHVHPSVRSSTFLHSGVRVWLLVRLLLLLGRRAAPFPCRWCHRPTAWEAHLLSGPGILHADPGEAHHPVAAPALVLLWSSGCGIEAREAKTMEQRNSKGAQRNSSVGVNEAHLLSCFPLHAIDAGRLTLGPGSHASRFGLRLHSYSDRMCGVTKRIKKSRRMITSSNTVASACILSKIRSRSSSSIAIITGALASTFLSVIAYLVDTPRTDIPSAFMDTYKAFCCR